MFYILYLISYIGKLLVNPVFSADGIINRGRGVGMFTSLGYHTFVMSKNLAQDEADSLFEELKKYRNNTGEICIMGPYKYDKDPLGRHFDIVYSGQYKGLSWKVRFCNRGFFIDGEYKPCSIKAVINPKVLVGEKSYIIAADVGYLKDVESVFNQEARKITPRLGIFSEYSLNRLDYCINFDITELKFSPPLSNELTRRLPEMIMTLIKSGDIPDHFKEEHSGNERYQFYLKSKSVVINCYWKHDDLRRNFIDCKDLEKSYDIIRFEIQFKYPKVYTASSDIKKERNSQKMIQEKKMGERGFEDFSEDQDKLDEMQNTRLYKMYMKSIMMNQVVIMETMLSDERCSGTIEDYFNKVVKRGDYYTFDIARKKIESQVSKWEKVVRLTNTLQMIYDYGGITNAKGALQNKELEEFRRSLRDLEALRINPVTIPEEWGIDYIPNLLGNYYELCAEEQRKTQEEKDNKQLLQDYFKDCRKREISWI